MTGRPPSWTRIGRFILYYFTFGESGCYFIGFHLFCVHTSQLTSGVPRRLPRPDDIGHARLRVRSEYVHTARAVWIIERGSSKWFRKFLSGRGRGTRGKSITVFVDNGIMMFLCLRLMWWKINSEPCRLFRYQLHNASRLCLPTLQTSRLYIRAMYVCKYLFVMLNVSQFGCMIMSLYSCPMWCVRSVWLPVDYGMLYTRDVE